MVTVEIQEAISPHDQSHSSQGAKKKREQNQIQFFKVEHKDGTIS